MIFSYLGHHSIEIKPGLISFIATNNPTVFSEIISGLNSFGDAVQIFDNSYNKLELSKCVDFDTDIIFNHKLYDKYNKNLVSTVINNMTDDMKGELNNDIRKLYSTIQESLFMTDLPIEVAYDGDLKRIINYSHLHFALSRTLKAYDQVF